MPSDLILTLRKATTLHIHFLYLRNLVIDMRVTCCLKDLMPLLCLRVELVHIVSPTVRVCSREQVKETPMLDNRMTSSRGVNDLIVNDGVFILPS